MAENKDTLDVHVNVKISGVALETIVETVKRIAGRDEKGRFRVDTADKVGEMISLFLERFDFERFVQDENNYPPD